MAGSSRLAGQPQPPCRVLVGVRIDHHRCRRLRHVCRQVEKQETHRRERVITPLPRVAPAFPRPVNRYGDAALPLTEARSGRSRRAFSCLLNANTRSRCLSNSDTPSFHRRCTGGSAHGCLNRHTRCRQFRCSLSRQPQLHYTHKGHMDNTAPTRRLPMPPVLRPPRTLA
jgi:hypothetical protein